ETLPDLRSFSMHFDTYTCTYNELVIPLVQRMLTIENNKQRRKVKNYNQVSSIMEYSHLIHLDLCQIHDDYIEQFLRHMKMCFAK
ncbi:unnamed protein product, partial [Rotaria sp. Silwood1]